MPLTVILIFLAGMFMGAILSNLATAFSKCMGRPYPQALKLFKTEIFFGKFQLSAGLFSDSQFEFPWIFVGAWTSSCM